MNYVVSTEKSLKHWLKRKVTITTGTIVGFLIMGTVSFGQNQSPAVKIENNYDKQEYVVEKDINLKIENGEAKGIYVDKIVDLGITITNDKNITIEGIKEVHGIQGNNNVNIKVINGEKGEIKTSGKGSVFAVQTNGTGRGEVTNSGFISVKSTELYQEKNSAQAIVLKNGGTVLNNENGRINVEAVEGLAEGISITAKGNNETKIKNDGKIEVSGKTTSTGINLFVDKDYLGSAENMIENNGIIKVIGEKQISAIDVRNKSGKEVSIVNGENGILDVDGNGKHDSGAVKLNSDKTDGGKGEKVTFINKGTIKIKDGTAVSLTGKNAIAKLGGKIEVSGNSIVVNNSNGTAEVTGTITLTDKSQENITQNDIDSLFKGEVQITGIIADKNNIQYETSDRVYLSQGTTDDINTFGKDSQSVTMGNPNIKIGENEINIDRILPGGSKAANIKSLNIVGDVKVGEYKDKDKDNTDQTIEIAVKDLNLDANGKLYVAQEDTLKITGSNVNKLENLKEKSREAIVLRENSKLILDGANVNGADITGVDSSATIETSGNTSFNGTIKNVGKINVADKGNLSLSADSKYEKTTKNADKAEMEINGNVNLAVGTEKNSNGEYTQNFFHNSNGLIKATGNGTITVGTENINGKTAVINLGKNNTFASTLTSKFVGNSIYEIKNGLENGKIEIVYKSNIFGNGILDAINGQAYDVNALFDNNNLENRKTQMDKVYSANIYSETVKATYDNIKINEEAVESLARKSQVGKWTAEGKALYSKNEYNRTGIVGEYSSDIESTGLMAVYGYGLNETTTAGIAFSGVKQDVNTDGGSADADLFYLGVYGNKAYGNYDLTAGLGYQFGKYDADNQIANIHSSDKYDTQVLSGYVQGRYTANLGDGLSVQPKVRLGYTYIDQDNAKDSYFGVSDAEISTFDTEVGFDVVKSVQFEKSQADIKFGLSYTKAMGDTDKKFRGSFKGGIESFDVLGAELAENTVKFNLGAEVTNENGFFYNGGFTYKFGSDDTKAYGVNVGAGYKF